MNRFIDWMEKNYFTKSNKTMIFYIDFMSPTKHCMTEDLVIIMYSISLYLA